MIVPGFNILKHLQAHLYFYNKLCSIDQFRYKRFEEAFYYDIIRANTFSTHTLNCIKRLQKIECLNICVLSTSEFKIKKIQDKSELMESINARDICQVRYTSFNGFVTFKIPVEQIWSYLKIMSRIGGNLIPFRKFTAQSHSINVTGNSASINNPTVSQQVFSKSGTTVSTFGYKVGFSNLSIKFHIISFAFTIRGFKPAVIEYSGNTKYFTYHLNRPSVRVEVFDKLKDKRPLLEMMYKAFLIISLSISASIKRFSSLSILLLSSLTDWLPFPVKLEPSFSWNSLRHRYNKNDSIPNSCASSDTFLLSKLNLTSFSLNALSKCIRCFLIILKSKLLCLSPCPI